MSLDSAEAGSSHVDTAILGNGPSALILSFILSGNVPIYSRNHDDQLLHRHVHDSTDLLHLNSSVFEHVRSSLKYSNQALPINVVLDALQRPDRDVSSDAPAACVQWLADPVKAVDHVVLGEAPRPGGQWTDNPVITTWNIGTLSYAEQLSLPGWSFAQYWKQTYETDLPDFTRPSRTDVASYFAAYPAAVGIASRIHTSARVSGVRRVKDGFQIASHNLTCRHLVLATGTFSINLPPPRSLSLLSASTSASASEQGAVLIIGSGFTAADLIVSVPPQRKIIHVYNWNPENRPSPLQGCHSQAYPEYAWIYRQMKLAAIRQGQDKGKLRSMKFKAVSELPYFNDRDWSSNYEGYANAEVFASGSIQEASATAERRILIRMPGVEEPVHRDVSTLHYATGRRGSLAYLSESLLHEVLDTTSIARPASDPDPWNGPADSRPQSHYSPHASTDALNNPFRDDSAIVSGPTLRPKLEELNSMEVAEKVYVVGSLTGDSLVRFALGGCCSVAGNIMDDQKSSKSSSPSSTRKDDEGKENDEGLDSRTSSTQSPDLTALPSFEATDAATEVATENCRPSHWPWPLTETCRCTVS